MSEKVTIPKEYLNFTNVFSEKSAAELPKYTSINDFTIDLKEGRQPPYGIIYSLGPVKLEIFKTYIKTNLINGFIHPSNDSTSTFLLFVQKPNGSFWLYVNY